MDSRVEEIRSIVMCDGNIIRDLTKDEALYLLEALDRAKAENEAFRRLIRAQKKVMDQTCCHDCGLPTATLEEQELAWIEVERIMGDGE